MNSDHSYYLGKHNVNVPFEDFGARYKAVVMVITVFKTDIVIG